MDAPRSRPRDVLPYLLGVVLLSWAITTVWLAMRAVMDIGGMCAEGGPYVIETPCPDGVPLLMILAFPGGFLGVGMMLAWGSRLGHGWASLAALAWPALFLSLGWNFLEYGLDAPGGIELGWLIPGVAFLLMGGVPLVIGACGALAVRRTRGNGVAAPRDATSASAARGAMAGSITRAGSPDDHPASSSRPASGPGPDTDQRRARAELARALCAAAGAASVAAADQVTIAEALPTRDATDPLTDRDDTSMVAQLERLAALKRDGALGELEYLRAKQAVIDAAARGEVA